MKEDRKPRAQVHPVVRVNASATLAAVVVLFASGPKLPPWAGE